MTVEWYRNTTWDPDTRAMFFARLARARSQRDQCIVIQALTLALLHPEATLELVQLYFETRTDDFNDGRAALARTKALISLGRLDEIADAYRDTIARDAANDSLKTGAAGDYVAFVIEHHLSARYDEILSLLGDAPGYFLMPLDGYRWHSAHAVIADYKGQAGEARVHAKAALGQAARTTSDLPGHPKLGLVPGDQTDLRSWLQKCAAGSA